MRKSGRAMAERLREKMQLDAAKEAPVESVFEIEPVPLTVFIQDKAYLGNPALSMEQFWALRHLEQIFLPETYPAMIEMFGADWDPVRFINFCYLEWGKGSGKDHICRLATARAMNLLMCLHSPQSYFEMPAQDFIQALNVASSASQANRAFFKPLRYLVRKAPCFRNRYETRDGTRKSKSKDGDLPGQYSIVFDKQLEAISGHSEVETQEGLNIIIGIADEIAAFRTREEIEKFMRTTGREPTKSAEAILKMMRTSARTRFPRNFKIAAISYPRFLGDAIQQLRARGEADNKKHGTKSRVYVSGPKATWEVNPRVKSKDDFREDYEEDPAMARAMYECKPDQVMSTFFRNQVAIANTFNVQRPEPVVMEYYWGKDDEGLGRFEPRDDQIQDQDAWQVRFHFAEDFLPIQGALYCIHGDMAVRRDRAGVAMSHVKEFRQGQWHVDRQVVEEARPVVKLDFVTAFEADLTASPPREIQIRWFRKLIWNLVTRGFVFGKATFDRFQSVDTMQILDVRGIETDKVSTDLTTIPWDTLRDVMNEGRLEAYFNPQVISELQRLLLLPNGRVDHPPGGSKDMADSVAASVMTAIEVGGQEAEDRAVSKFFLGDPFSTGGFSEEHDSHLALMGARSFQDLGPGRGP